MYMHEPIIIGTGRTLNAYCIMELTSISRSSKILSILKGNISLIPCRRRREGEGGRSRREGGRKREGREKEGRREGGREGA